LEDYSAKDPTNAEVESLLQTVKTRIAENQAAMRKDQVTKLLNDAQREEQQNNFQKAMEHYEEILKIDPLNEAAQNGLTNARVQLANTTSREKLQQEIEQAFSQARKDFAEGKYAKARLELTQILTLDPGNSKAKSLLADVEKKLEGAAEPPDKSGKAESLVASARNEIRKKNYDRARAILDELAKLDPAHPQLGPMRKTIEQETAGPKYGSITINCEPFGNAFIDGQPIGETPIPLRKILAGQHVISIRRPGFKEVSRTITVQEDAVQHLQFALEKE
jgi:tetratricopeptide (TPR) repeat protein